LGSSLYPEFGSLGVQLKILACFQGLIRPDFLDELAIARAPAISDHNAKNGFVDRPDSL
jgi:hypothetical protein